MIRSSAPKYSNMHQKISGRACGTPIVPWGCPHEVSATQSNTRNGGKKKRKGSWEAFVGMCLHIKSLSLVMSIYSLVAINKLYLNLNRIIKNEIYGNFSSLY